MERGVLVLLFGGKAVGFGEGEGHFGEGAVGGSIADLLPVGDGDRHSSTELEINNETFFFDCMRIVSSCANSLRFGCRRRMGKERAF